MDQNNSEKYGNTLNSKFSRGFLEDKIFLQSSYIVIGSPTWHAPERKPNGRDIRIITIELRVLTHLV